MKKHLLYLTVIAASISGGLWLYWNQKHYHSGDINSGFNLCLFKRITGIPCPSCGTTRSLLYISRFDLEQAWQANPFGFILALGMVVFPFWIAYDLLFRKSSFYHFYRGTEFFMQKKWVALPLIALVLTNWLWNIHKNY